MNKMKEFTVSKQIIVPKGQYDNIKVMMSITYEGDMDYDMAWAELNLELGKEVESVEKQVQDIAPKVEPTSKAYTSEPRVGVKMCEVHNIEMKEAISKRTNKPYTFHTDPEKGICFGQEWKQKGL